MIATTFVRISASAPSESDELLSFRLGFFVNRLFRAQADQAGLSMGDYRGLESVSTRHPPLEPLLDPIPQKIRLPIS